MVAGWLVQQSNESSYNRFFGEQNIQNQLDGVAWNKKSWVLESFSYSQRTWLLIFVEAVPTKLLFPSLKNIPSFFSSFLSRIFSSYSCQFGQKTLLK